MPTQYTVSHRGQQFGPHTRTEVASMLSTGMIDTTAAVWCEEWPDWRPVTKLIPAAVSAAAAVSTPAVSKPAVSTPAVSTPPVPSSPSVPTGTLGYTSRQNTPGLTAYRTSVGRRSFIFQIILAVWTVLYFGWLAVGAIVSEVNAPPAGKNVVFVHQSSFVETTTALGVGWGVVGLPLIIAAVATLKPDET